MSQDAENGHSPGIALEPGGKRLGRAEFQGLGDMPPELEWFANLDNPRTRRAYQLDVREFTAFAGVERPEEMRQVTRAHLIAWRKDLERRGLAPSSIRRKLAAVASLFDHLCEVNAVSHNPVRGVKRPKFDANEGKTPALGDGQARALLDAPPPEVLVQTRLKRLSRGDSGGDDRTELGTGSLQGTALRSRDHHPVRAVVPDLQTQFS